jgi:chromosome segregation ATPase
MEQDVRDQFARIDDRFARVDERFDRIEQSFQGLERLITDFKDSLEREVQEGFAQVTARFDTQATRLDRHAAL